MALQVKQEKKGAMRELRKDAQMLQAEKMRKRLEFEAERESKRKEILATLARENQEFAEAEKKTKKPRKLAI